MTSVGQLYRERLIDDLKNGVNDSSNVFVLNYSQITSSEFSEFRKNCKQAGARVFVMKNSIAKLALKDLKHESLAECISGQTAFVWSNTDSVEVSKLLVNFAKSFENVNVPGGLLGDKLLSEADVKTLSDLPSKDV